MTITTKGVRRHGTGYLAEPMFKKRRYRYTFRTELEAAEWLARAHDANKRGLPIPEPVGTVGQAKIQTIKELADHVYAMRWASQRSGEKSLECAMCFVRWTGPNVSADVALTTANIHGYVAHMTKEKKSGGTINRHLARISALAAMAKALKMISDRPDFKQAKQKEGSHRLRYYEHEEEAAIYAKLREWDDGGDMLDWIDYFTFLADMGTRPSEAQKFLWRDYRQGVCHFEETKTDLARSLKPTARAKAALDRQRLRHPGSAGPFAWVSGRSSRTLWDRLRAHIKWMDKHTVIYTFRHTCASRLTMGGVSLHRIKVYLGHKTINTTLRYAKLAPEQVNIATEALDAINQQQAAAA